jgi:hypothetical protein
MDVGCHKTTLSDRCSVLDSSRNSNGLRCPWSPFCARMDLRSDVVIRKRFSLSHFAIADHVLFSSISQTVPSYGMVRSFAHWPRFSRDVARGLFPAYVAIHPKWPVSRENIKSRDVLRFFSLFLQHAVMPLEKPDSVDPRPSNTPANPSAISTISSNRLHVIIAGFACLSQIRIR